jgi:hypothetical protein
VLSLRDRAKSFAGMTFFDFIAIHNCYFKSSSMISAKY